MCISDLFTYDMAGALSHTLLSIILSGYLTENFKWFSSDREWQQYVFIPWSSFPTDASPGSFSEGIRYRKG